MRYLQVNEPYSYRQLPLSLVLRPLLSVEIALSSQQQLQMPQFKRFYALLLLLSMALALRCNATSTSSSSSTNPPWYTGSSTSNPIFARIATIDNCTQDQVEVVAHILATNKDVLACEVDVSSKNLFNLTDPTVLCPDKSCRSGLNTLYKVLPDCKYNVLYAFQYLSGALLRNCGLKPGNMTDLFDSLTTVKATITPALATTASTISCFTSGKSRILNAMEALVAQGVEV